MHHQPIRAECCAVQNPVHAAMSEQWLTVRSLCGLLALICFVHHCTSAPENRESPCTYLE